MPNRLANAVSPYLLSHADNPVDWQQWGPEPFAEAAERGVPVLISIGYSTCHWCHVMARESFSDPVLAAYLNENFVSIKVDREEHPDVDSSYLASAGVFTEQLGWPLNVFTTPEGKTFYAGTYFPPVPIQDRASFRQILDAVLDAWTNRRAEVDTNADYITAAIAQQSTQKPGPLPTAPDFAAIVSELLAFEDAEFGGFGGAPKFPVATILGFLLDRETVGDAAAGGLARRTLDAMASSPLRDSVEGGFFRYATRRDWSDPHYERMLYDNALLLGAYARAGRGDVADGIASFLLTVLRVPGGFASAQDSESTVNGDRVEGGYYALDAAGRAQQSPPALDAKVLTGWNGLAIAALASAGTLLGRPDWIAAAAEVADLLSDTIVRARIGDATSTASPTLEDYGMLANGLVELGLATGEARHLERARSLIAATIDAAATSDAVFAVPGGADPVLAAAGLALDVDPSEGAYPSGLSSAADAARKLHLLTGDATLLVAATTAMELLAPLVVQRPIAFGAALGVMSALNAPARQLVVVGSETVTGEGVETVASIARTWQRSGAVTSVVTQDQADSLTAAGFELYEGRTTTVGQDTAYLCEDFLCQLPVTEPEQLAALLS